MSAIWNHLSPLRTGHVKIRANGNELFGTVYRIGKMDKTVTVSHISTNYSPFQKNFIQYNNV